MVVSCGDSGSVVVYGGGCGGMTYGWSGGGGAVSCDDFGGDLWCRWCPEEGEAGVRAGLFMFAR